MPDLPLLFQAPEETSEEILGEVRRACPDTITFMSKFKVGDTVRIRNDKKDVENQLRLSDLESDMQMDLADRSLSGREYDIIWAAIEQGKPLTITAINDEGDYELKAGKVAMSYTFAEDQLEAAG